MCGTDCFLMLLSVLFPPIGVWVKRGVCGADSLINIALCCLGFLPGLLHAWYIILQNPETYEYRQVPDGEHGNRGTTYYVISHEQPGRQPQPSYGTVANPSAGKQPKNTKVAKNAPAPQGAQAGGEGSSNQPEGPPPTYADVIKGDHKVQDP